MSKSQRDHEDDVHIVASPIGHQLEDLTELQRVCAVVNLALVYIEVLRRQRYFNGCDK